MKNICATLLAALIACSIMLPALNLANVGYALPGPRIYLNPSANTFYSNVTSVGDRFNVTVRVDNATSIGGVQVYLEFNDSIINVTRWYEPTADPQYVFYGRTTSALPTPPDPGYVNLGLGQARVLISTSLFPPTPPYFTGNGTICIFEFEITAEPAENEQFTCPLTINTIDTYLLDGDSGNEVAGVTKENGTYTFVGVPALPKPPHMWVETSPSSYEAVKLRPFNVTISIYNVSQNDALIGVQFELRYNSSWLDAAAIYQGDFMNNSMWAPDGSFASFYHEANRAVYGEIILPNATGEWNPPFPEGNGTLAIVTLMPQQHAVVDPNWAFNIVISPLFDQLFLDKEGEYIPYLPPKGCEYSYNPVPLPTLAVSPSLYTASHVGETFKVDITIADLDALWELTYAEFTLKYNGSFLSVVNMTEGDFMKGFGTTVPAYEEGTNYVKVNITLTPDAEYPSGSGVLASILFNVIHTPGRSHLTLSSTALLDVTNGEILHTAHNGYYRLHERLVHPIVWDSHTYNVVTLSNASITPVPMVFIQPHAMLAFNVTDEDGYIGFVDVTIPKDLLKAESTGWYLIVGGQPIQPAVVENATHTTLSFHVSLSTKSVYILGTWVVPEITLNAILVMFLLVTVIGLAAVKAFRTRKPETLIQTRQ